jgi:amidohydrolase
MIGTIRTFSETQQKLIHRRMQEIATNIAESAGATADLKINIGVPVTYNDPTLTEKMGPTLSALAGKENILTAPLATGAEDFSFFGKKVPAFFFFLGGKPIGSTAAAPHHTPDFFIDDSGLCLGVKALCHLTVDYFEKK